MMAFFEEERMSYGRLDPDCYKPLQKSSFEKFWGQYRSTLRIMKEGSDYCDTCTNFQNFIASSAADEMRDTMKRTLVKNRKD